MVWELGACGPLAGATTFNSTGSEGAVFRAAAGAGRSSCRNGGGDSRGAGRGWSGRGADLGAGSVSITPAVCRAAGRGSASSGAFEVVTTPAAVAGPRDAAPPRYRCEFRSSSQTP